MTLRTIPNEALRADRMPPPNAPWSQLIPFALTFNGYDLYPAAPALGDFVTQTRDAFAADGTLPDDLSLLRAALFGEQRIDYFNGGYDHTPEQMRFIHALVEAIRARAGRAAR